jgi:flagellar biosynthesis component FlhA
MSTPPFVHLHCHSHYSKGKVISWEALHSPAEIVRAARARGLAGIALTDHDTNKGWKEAAAEAKKEPAKPVEPAKTVTVPQIDRISVEVGYQLVPLVDPNKADILAAEEAARLAEAARVAAKAQAIVDNLPSWATVDSAITAIANLADAKAFIRKLARVLYWLAKDKED